MLVLYSTRLIRDVAAGLTLAVLFIVSPDRAKRAAQTSGDVAKAIDDSFGSYSEAAKPKQQ